MLRNSFPIKKWIHLSGDNFLAQGYSAEPDYYIRFKNKIFLFESKDVVLKGEEKQSRDYPIVQNALKKKFYKIDKEGKIEAKAVLQLIENIKRILTKYYDKCDDGYNPANVKIYPILIVHDRQFDSLGVNRLVSKWFKKELVEMKDEFNIYNIQDITVINIDSILLHQETFKKRGNNRIEKIISDYHKNIKFIPENYRSQAEKEQKILNSFRSFTNFVDTELSEIASQRMPSYIMEYVKELFNESEYENEVSP